MRAVAIALPASHAAPAVHAVSALDHSPAVDSFTGWQALGEPRPLQIGGKDRAPQNTLAARGDGLRTLNL